MNKTQIVQLRDTHVGDVLKFNEGYFEVSLDGNGNKGVRGVNLAENSWVERVITQNPLIRLKRYLIG